MTFRFLNPTRPRLADFTKKILQQTDQPRTEVKHLINAFSAPAHYSFCQFLVDCLALPEVISAFQAHGPDVFNNLLHVGRDAYGVTVYIETD